MFLGKFVDGKSINYSDGRERYTILNSYFKYHKIVNHSSHYKAPATGFHTNTIDGNWNGLKRQIPLNCRNKRFAYIYLLRLMLATYESEGCFKNIIQLLLVYNI